MSRTVGSVEIKFNDKALIEKYRKRRDAAQMVLKQLIVLDSDQFVPMESGVLKNSTALSLRDTEPRIIYNTPYAHYIYQGWVMEDPVLHCAGFLTPQGWKSRRNVQKVYREPRQALNYKVGQSRWFEHAKGLYKDRWIEAVEKVIKDGK